MERDKGAKRPAPSSLGKGSGTDNYLKPGTSTATKKAKTTSSVQSGGEENEANRFFRQLLNRAGATFKGGHAIGWLFLSCFLPLSIVVKKPLLSSPPEDGVVFKRNLQKLLLGDASLQQQFEASVEAVIDEDEQLKHCLQPVVSKTNRFVRVCVCSLL